MESEARFVVAEEANGIELSMPQFWVSHNGSKQSLISGPSLVQHSYPNNSWSFPAFCNINFVKKVWETPMGKVKYSDFSKWPDITLYTDRFSEAKC